MEELDLLTLHGQMTTQAAQNEASAKETYPSGWYNFQTERADAYIDTTVVFGGSGNPNPNFNRKMIVFHGTLTDNEGKHIGRIPIRTSFEERRNGEGKLDKEVTLYLKMQKALGAQEEDVPGVVEAAKSYPVRVRVNEWFRNGSGEFKSAQTPEERLSLVQQGYDSGNSVKNIEAIR